MHEGRDGAPRVFAFGMCALVFGLDVKSFEVLFQRFAPSSVGALEVLLIKETLEATSPLAPDAAPHDVALGGGP